MRFSVYVSSLVAVPRSQSGNDCRYARASSYVTVAASTMAVLPGFSVRGGRHRRSDMHLRLDDPHCYTVGVSATNGRETDDGHTIYAGWPGVRLGVAARRHRGERRGHPDPPG